MKTRTILFMLIFYMATPLCKAQEQREIIFDHEKYQKVNKPTGQKDTCIAFINIVLSKNFEKSKKLRPDIFLVDVSSGMISIKGKESFLAGLGDYLDTFSSDSYDLLALSVFLKEKYNTRKDLYDKMLRGSLRLDSNNVSALYLLAKFRYENGIINDAFYLVKQLFEIDKGSEEINALYFLFKETYGALDDDLPSLEEFLKYDVSYYEED